MTNSSKESSVSGVLLLGLKVWGREMKRLAKLLVDSYEIRRLRRRLDQECMLLGRMAAEGSNGGQRKLCLNQIAFMKEELKALALEREKHRSEPVSASGRKIGG